MQKKNRSRKTHDATNKTANLAVKTNGPKTARRREGYIRSIVPKTLSRTRSDIATWRSALRAADNVDNPRRARLMNLYEATAVLNAASWVTELNTHILDSVMYGHTLVELTTTGNTTEPVAVTLLPRQNVIPEKGMLLFREDDSKGLQYREVREFGNFILEFGKDHDYGLLNKAVPHVLFMRFAQSCWSELCEIYGIPPRFMKTDTQDPAMLDRAEAMLRDMGAAAYFIIDRTEEFQFAKGADTNGDVYNNLIALCKEAVSVLVNGAVIGQDTVNGNRSKEESSIRLFEKLVMADRKMLAGYWNSTVIPALVYIGILPEGSVFSWQQEEDVQGRAERLDRGEVRHRLHR